MASHLLGIKLLLRHIVLVWLATAASALHAHESTRLARRTTEQPASGKGEEEPIQSTRPKCRLALELTLDDRPTAGLVRVTDVATGQPVALDGAIHRQEHWYSIDVKASIQVPATRMRIDAIHGIETELSSHVIDLNGRAQAKMQVPLRRCYAPKRHRLVSGNTHLHLKDLSYHTALEYLNLVPRSDGLDLVFLSHLRRIPQERRYISNQIVEQSLANPEDGPLARLSEQTAILRPGEEHRHNFGPRGEGFGHVMLLDIQELIRPVSIGPGIMGSGTDSVPLQRGIQAARADEATVVWCHAAYGLEDLANWLLGLIDAQNIFDGGSLGKYEIGFYRYLNLGLKVPFSTGTDWFVYDFSRVYVPLEDNLTSERWLAALAEGRSCITNSTFLEFSVAGAKLGDTIDLPAPTSLKVNGRGIGRLNFGRLELVSNGQVVAQVDSRRQEGHYLAEMDIDVEVDEPGWLALRTPTGPTKNELGNELFAHTSPVYITMDGRQIFQPEIAQALIADLKESIVKIDSSAAFANATERSDVLQVYQTAIRSLERKLQTE